MARGVPDLEDKDFTLFTEKVKGLTAIDLNLYKEVQMKRRLNVFRLKKGFANFQAMYGEMAANPPLLDEFLDRMTINVSEFFRNPERWQVLEKQFLRPMLQQNGGRLKCWSAACSTGEEPYTLAILLHRLDALSKATLLATDLDQGVLDKALKGIYAERALREVTPELRAQYFSLREEGYVFDEKLKKAVSFRRQNLLEDRFDSSFDVIICRNVMIYFTEEAKKVLYRKFAGALKPGGILFVGSTEQIFSPDTYGLEPADTFFYRKKPGAV